MLQCKIRPLRSAMIRVAALPLLILETYDQPQVKIVCTKLLQRYFEIGSYELGSMRVVPKLKARETKDDQ